MMKRLTMTACALLLVSCGKSPSPAKAPPPAAPTASDPARAAPAAAAPSAATQAAAPASPTPNKSGSGAKKASHSGAGTIDTSSGRLRIQPRKKTPHLELDLDGDGKAESMRAGQDGNRFHAEIRHGDTVLARREAEGSLTGWMRLPVRRGRGRHALFLQFTGTDDSAPRTWLAQGDAGRFSIEPFDWLPVAHWDLRGDGIEMVHGITTELYQDFLARGRSDLLDLSGAQPASVLPGPTFEVCVVDPDDATGDAPLRLVVARRDVAEIALMAVDTAGKLAVVAKHNVDRPDDGSRWSIPAGFALACLGEGKVQFKARHYRIHGDALLPAPVP